MDPYFVWISEIMLQQTQVTTVLPYYHRFITRFPTIDDLAQATEQEVLQYWSGLGYYRRARQLHAAAKKIATEYKGGFPESFDEILDLPGIGRYTAGAICSFAFDKPYPIVEANTQRLYARLMALDNPLNTSESQKSLWRFAEAILPARGARELNHAVMELGAIVCTPDPCCLVCPVANLCPTKKAGRQAEIPAKKQKVAFEDRSDIALIVRNRRNEILVRRYCQGEWWTGLWDFPRITVPATALLEKPSDRKQTSFQTDSSRECLLFTRESAVDRASTKGDMKLDLDGLRFSVGRVLHQLKHGVTKYRITLTCAEATLDNQTALRKFLKANDATEPRVAYQWIAPKDFVDLPMPSPGRKLAKQVVID